MPCLFGGFRYHDLALYPHFHLHAFILKLCSSNCMIYRSN